MKRYRLTTKQDSQQEFVSSWVYSLEEAEEQLEAEEMIHKMGGWDVNRRNDKLIVCTRGTVTRKIRIRESDPFNDTT